MTEKILTEDEALALLERAVQEKGADHRPTSVEDEDGCRYFADDGVTPVCIVGHVFSYLGARCQDLSDSEPERVVGFGDRTPNGLLVDTLRVDGLDLKPALSVLYAAQARQDSGDTWGEALYAARRAAR